MRIFFLFLIVTLFTGCGYFNKSESTISSAICPITKKILYFPGRCNNCDNNFDRSIDIYKTPLAFYDEALAKINKPTGWWVDKEIYKSCTNIKKVAGFSGGRVPLLRRIYEGYSADIAILIDPSIEDGVANYQDPSSRKLAKSGVSIINTWLRGHPSRKFYFAYIASAGNGHEAYVNKDNYSQEVRTQVTLCKRKVFSTVGHSEFANALGPDFLLNPESTNLVECDTLK